MIPILQLEVLFYYKNKIVNFEIIVIEQIATSFENGVRKYP